MLLQTNSYIVPTERRAEHARLIRRFRQALARIGCDQFEVYEQVGANWSPGGANGRYVQIMRFRDRQHQQAVQAAERNDHGAQQIISEFCDLINFPYQQQHGYFATGFYASVLPTGPRQAVDHEAQDLEEAPIEGAAATIDPFADRGMPPDIDPIAVTEELQAADIPFDEAEEHSESEEDEALAETVAQGEDEEGPGDDELHVDVPHAGEPNRFQEPHLEAPDLGFAETPIRIPPIPSAAASDAMTIDAHLPQDVAPQDSADTDESTAPAEPGDELFESAEIAEVADLPLGESANPQTLHATCAPSDTEHTAPATPETSEHEPLAAEFDLEAEEFGLLFEDEMPGDPLASADSDTTVAPEFELHEPAPVAFIRREPPPVISPAAADLPRVAEHHEPHEELLPPILDSYGSDHDPMKVHNIASDEAGLDALLDDANLLDNVPFSGLDDAPRLHSRREPAGHGHDAPGEKETDLLEFEAMIRELEEDPSTDRGHLR